VIINQSIQLLI